MQTCDYSKKFEVMVSLREVAVLVCGLEILNFRWVAKPVRLSDLSGKKRVSSWPATPRISSVYFHKCVKLTVMVH